MEGSGKPAEIDRAIATHRQYLLLVADRAMSPTLKTKEGASDLVQEALLTACRTSGQLQRKTPRELRRWLRRVLLNQVAHAARRYLGTQKRRLGCETSMDASRDGWSVADALAIDEPSPGAAASRREDEARMRTALDRLPEREQKAVFWRHHDGCTFVEIGRRLGCSDVAARDLWFRALNRLRDELDGLSAG